MKKKYRLQFFLIILISVLLISTAEYIDFKFDATQHKIYTLSKYSNNLINNLDDNISITWFTSKNAKKFFPSIYYIDSILKEYKQLEKTNVSFVNTDTLTIDAISKLELLPQQIQTGTINKQTIENVYSSIMIEYKNHSKVIPFIFDVTNLEYSITTNILQLMQDVNDRTNKRHIYLVVDQTKLNSTYMYVIPFLEYAGFIPIIVDNYFTEFNIEYPLIVIGSEYINDTILQKIDIFLKQNGCAAFFISANTINLSGQWENKIKEHDKLITLLYSYGFFIAPDLILDIFNFNLNMKSKIGAGSEIINYPFWIRINKPQIDTKQLFFAGYQTLQTFWPSSIILDKQIDNTLTPIMKTSKKSIRMIEEFNTDPFDFPKNLFEKLPNSENIIGAISTKHGRIIVISDEYMFSNTVDFTGSDYNIEFMINITEWLSKKDDLLKLKNKQKLLTPFYTFNNPNTLPRIILFSRIINFIILPTLIIVIIIFIKRREKTL